MTMEHVCLVRSWLEPGLVMHACKCSPGEVDAVKLGLFKTRVRCKVRKHGQFGLHESPSQKGIVKAYRILQMHMWCDDHPHGLFREHVFRDFYVTAQMVADLTMTRTCLFSWLCCFLFRWIYQCSQNHVLTKKPCVYTSKQNKNKIQEKFKSLGWKVFQICGSGNDEFYVSIIVHLQGFFFIWIDDTSVFLLSESIVYNFIKLISYIVID